MKVKIKEVKKSQTKKFGTIHARTTDQRVALCGEQTPWLTTPYMSYVTCEACKVALDQELQAGNIVLTADEKHPNLSDIITRVQK
jgi:hypothetical protein